MANQESSELISLPSGGGAVRPLGETFQPDLHTGTGTYAVPIELPPGRSGLAPTLSLNYSSGNGTGPFGLGWELRLPEIRRKTAQRIPRYDGGDVFVLSGNEDLVPVSGGAPDAQRYRPRVDNLFARIEHLTAGTDHWQVWSGSGLRSTYGTPRPADAPAGWVDPAVVADPDRPDAILGWLLSRSWDSLGNELRYRYEGDPDDPRQPQRYLSEVDYGDYPDPADPTATRYLVQVRLRYEPRGDRHCDRRGGFPVRTTRRCTAIEVWTDAGTPQLVRSLALRYGTAASGASLLAGITLTGHDGDTTESLPELSFGYSVFEPAGRRYRRLTAAGGALPATSLAHPELDLVDLYGDGLPGVLQLSATGARYWRNRGQGVLDRPRGLSPVPAGAVLGGPGVALADLDGDGRADLLVNDGGRAGYFPVAGGGFDPAGYVRYRSAPAFALTDPQTRLIDLDGDGVVDAVRTGAVPQVYLNDRAAGWQPQPVRSGGVLSQISFADPRIRLADMTGDGLTDIVLVTGAQVRYWPNLGYGRFGAPVVMTGFAVPDGEAGFDPHRLLLGDVDGDGCADLVYVGHRGTRVWLNQAGETLGAPVTVPGTPDTDGSTALRLADVFGTGTSGVLWSADATGRDGGYTFLDLTGGVKPYLLTAIDNNAGGQTSISYDSSVRHALRDAAAGTPWRSSLPVPVAVVASVTSTDAVSGSQLTTGYTYHHGYWDGAEREFRGFGRVDRLDTERFDPAGPVPQDAYSPPALTRTWFHLGPVGPKTGAWREVSFADEYWSGDPDLLGSGDRSGIPATLPRAARRSALRALAGRVLRTELYGLDGTDRQDRPYSVEEHRYDLRPVGDPGDPAWQACPVVSVAGSGHRTTVWERGDDPQTRVTFTGGFDEYGRATRTAGVAIARGRDPRASGAGDPPLCTVNVVGHATRDDATGYRLDRTATATGYEVLTDGSGSLAELEAALAADTLPRRLRTYARNGYDGEPFAGLPVGQLGEHALLTSTTTLATTAGLVAAALRSPVPPPYLQIPPPGTGLLGEYFAGSGWQTSAFIRPDPALDLAWPAGPDPGLARPDFSVRWTGTLIPPGTGNYTFSAQGTGALAVWIGDRQVLGGDGTASPIALTAGTGYPIRAEYTVDSWPASVRLCWSTGATRPVPVPGAAFTPAPVPPPDGQWPDGYPPAFRDTVAPLAGYVYRYGDGPDPAGYYQVTGARYDVHTDPAGRGLKVATRDAMGNDTTVTHDPFAILPATVTDPAGLRHSASYDYRVLKPAEVVDPNGNHSRVRYTPLGLVAAVAALGAPGADQGDTDEQPGTTYTYALDAWRQHGQPGWAHILRRCEHRWSVVAAQNAARAAEGEGPLDDAGIAALFPPDEPTRFPERFVATRTYFDGLGRPVQTRTQSETLVVDDLGLPADPGVPAGPLTAHRADPAADPATVPVVVSGWQAYDNKGRVVRSWEPVAGTGWAYAPPGLDGLASARTFYDARGEQLRTVHPDGSQDLMVRGVPADLTAPDSYAPTPWEHYTYDRNDNAGRTHPTDSAAWSAHWNTPTSATVDTLGRLAASTERLAGDTAFTTSHRYDVDGRLLELTDPAGRLAAWHRYDLLGRRWASGALDAGDTVAVLDAAGDPVEHRDGKGALTLHAYDHSGRSVAVWAADAADGATTLRERTVYGDAADSGLPAAQAAAANLLGRPVREYDEAGLLVHRGYDLAGRSTGRSRQVLSAGVLVGAGAAPYVVDWQPAPGQSLDELAATLLDPVGYDTDEIWDALGRRTVLVCPTDTEGRRRTLTMRYSSRGGLRAVAVDGVDQLREVLYNARGQRVLAWSGNGILTRYRYDPVNLRLVRQHSQPASRTPADDTTPGTVSFTPAGPVGQDQGYRYDLVGNVLAVADRTPGAGVPGATPDALDRAFGYDPLYRLVSATGREHRDPAPAIWSAAPRGTDPTATQEYRESYAYDPVGNLLTLTHRGASNGYTRSLTLAPDGNRVTSLHSGPDAFDYAHDASGNLVREGDSRHFAWNGANQLAAFWVQPSGAATPSVTGQYRYDASGERVLKLVVNQGGGTELTVSIDGDFERLAVGAPTGAADRYDEVHVHDGDTRIAVLRLGVPLPGDARPAQAYHLVDHLGSSVAVLDGQGGLVNREEYTPYGETTFGSYGRKRYRYSGRERDEESGLARHGHRYYAPWLCRWTSIDPAGTADGTALYSYVRGNPMRLVDHSGLAGVPGNLDVALLGDGPLQHVTQLWEKAINQVMGTSTTREGLAKFEKLVQQAFVKNGMGSNRKVGTAINVARENFKKVRAVFGRLAEAEGVSVKGLQVHHLFGKDGIGGLAHNPWGALDPTGLKIVSGNAGKPGTLHNLLHTLESRLRGRPAEMVGKLAKGVGEGAAARGARLVKGLEAGMAGFGAYNAVHSAIDFASDVQHGRVAEAIGHGADAISGAFDVASWATGGAAGSTAVTTSVAAAPLMAVGSAAAAGFATGYAVGTEINRHLSTDTQLAIGGTVNEVVNEGGWKLLFTHPFGIGM